MVYFDLGMYETKELGLYNIKLRSLRGGFAVEEDHYGQLSAHLHMEPFEERAEFDNPWLFIDVDDSWLFYDRGKSEVTAIVECFGSYLGAEKLGFNIMYDTVAGYRSTPWQWVEPGYAWYRYRIPLPNSSFANREGWDLRINAKGSLQDMWIKSVVLEKRMSMEPLPPPLCNLGSSETPATSLPDTP
jgi:hypothetical protein